METTRLILSRRSEDGGDCCWLIQPINDRAEPAKGIRDDFEDSDKRGPKSVPFPVWFE